MMKTDTGSFKYQTEPKALKGKAKFRGDNDVTLTLMSDPRVVRGNTHSLARKVALNAQTAFDASARNKDKTGKNQGEQPFPTYFYDPTTFTADDLSISKYLVADEADTFVMTTDEATQSDSFLPRPPTPEYIPRKTGVDCATQIENPSELFVFDDEVKPILSVIVQKTIEQALFEVRSEAELLALNDAADEYRKKNDVEKKWVSEKEQTIMAEMRAKEEFKLRKYKEQREANKVRQLIAGRFCMQQLLPAMVDDICKDFYKTGEWEETTEAVVKKTVLPAIAKEVSGRTQRAQVAGALMDDVILAAQAAYDTRFYKAPSTQVIQMCFRIPKTKAGAEATDDVVLGPLKLNHSETVKTLAARIQELVAKHPHPIAYVIDGPALQGYLTATVGKPVEMDVYLSNYEFSSSVTVIV